MNIISMENLKQAILDLYSSVSKLQAAFPDRLFTPDGRMVGDIGEAIASLKFKVILDKTSKKHWDGHRIGLSGEKREVQVKATQRDETYLKKPPHDGDLVVIKINHDGTYDCFYDGPIGKVWDFLKDKKLDNTGAKTIKLNKLKTL